MEYLNGKKEIVIIGLNPTEEAIQNKSVFSTKKTFWNILKDADLINGYPNDLKVCADEIFGANKDLGFADLVPNCNEKKSSNVKISKHNVPTLLDKIQKTNAKKVVLLGHKVAEAFVKHFGLKMEWEQFKKVKWQYVSKGGNKECINYGFMCYATYQNGRKFDIYVMPFPETSPVPKKSSFYNKIK